jgi:hypothetical protein
MEQRKARRRKLVLHRGGRLSEGRRRPHQVARVESIMEINFRCLQNTRPKFLTAEPINAVVFCGIDAIFREDCTHVKH